MSSKRYIVEMDETLAALLKNSGQIQIIEHVQIDEARRGLASIGELRKGFLAPSSR